jgi:biopolymer transport protein TolR
MGEINVVPYIDVMLVLLIIFMVTAPLLVQGVQVELPRTGGEPIAPTEQVEILILSVDADGRYFLNVGSAEDEALEPAQVVLRASAVLRRRPETPVLVRADRTVEYGVVAQGMRMLQQSGAPSVSLEMDPVAELAVEVVE